MQAQVTFLNVTLYFSIRLVVCCVVLDSIKLPTLYVRCRVSIEDVGPDLQPPQVAASLQPESYLY